MEMVWYIHTRLRNASSDASRGFSSSTIWSSSCLIRRSYSLILLSSGTRASSQKTRKSVANSPSGESAGRLIAVRGLQGHRLEADRLQGGGHVGDNFARAGEFAELDVRQDQGHAGVAERGPAGEQAVERSAEAVDVAGGAEQVEPA